MKKISSVSVLALLVLFYTSCGKKENIDKSEEKAIVKSVDLYDAITQIGQVEPVVKVELKSEASGRIDKIYVREGQTLKKGERILSIDPTRLIFRKQAVDLSVQKAKLAMEIGKRNYEDSRKLLATGTVSQKNVEDLQNQYEYSRIEYEQQLLELKDIEDQLRQTVIQSPMNGVLTNLSVKEGEIAVAATSQNGSGIGIIADVSKLEIISKIGEVDYMHLRLGQKVIVTPEAVEGRTTQGTISFISSSAKRKEGENLGTFEVRITVDSIIPGVIPGVNVNVKFVMMEKKAHLALPVKFVMEEDGKWYVNRLVDNSVVKTPVTLGVTDYKYYEILSGVSDGDVVVTAGSGSDGKRKTKG